MQSLDKHRHVEQAKDAVRLEPKGDVGGPGVRASPGMGDENPPVDKDDLNRSCRLLGTR